MERGRMKGRPWINLIAAILCFFGMVGNALTNNLFLFILLAIFFVLNTFVVIAYLRKEKKPKEEKGWKL